MRITGVLQQGYAVIEQAQTYRNAEAVNIETTYTFPLPLEATLLNLTVQLDGRTLQGCVTERSHAEAQYEAAIAEGHSAVMLEQVEPGLYTLNVGNLMAGEQAEITMRFALPIRWAGRQARLALPTTVAPRYGVAKEEAVQPHQMPLVDAMVEHHYSLNLRVLGDMAKAVLASPSHALSCTIIEQGVELSFQHGTAPADRDFVLTVVAKSELASTLMLIADGDTQVAHALFRIPEHKGTEKLNLKILVDCSGSMAGDSMALARDCVLHALSQLGPGDCYSIAAFGSSVEHAEAKGSRWFQGSDETLMAQARRYALGLDAVMGGTDIPWALNKVFKLDSGTERQGGDVLMITDGETWERDLIVNQSREASHRIFVIGVGASPVEAVVRDIANATGGAGAFVSPNEDARLVVERHLYRMRARRQTSVHLGMPGEITWQTPEDLQGQVFPGDTLSVFCGLASFSKGNAVLLLRALDGGRQEILANIEDSVAAGIAPGDWLRIAAAAHIRELQLCDGPAQSAEVTVLALKHQLMSPFTNYLFVHQREEGIAKDLPELRQTPGMLAAGWGGAGRVRESGPLLLETRILDYLDTPMFSRRAAEPDYSPQELVEFMNTRFTMAAPEQQLARTLDEPSGLAGSFAPISREVVDDLRKLIRLGWREDEVLIAFWLVLMQHALVGPHFSSAHQCGIEGAARLTPVASTLMQWMSEALGGIDCDNWHWRPEHDMPVPHEEAEMSGTTHGNDTEIV
jgi:Ca-activated chloride channel family protein